MADSILRDKSKAFAKDIVFLCRRLRDSRVEGVLINQLLKSGTSVGANVHEAQYAQGTKDFISKGFRALVSQLFTVLLLL